ncbi:unnamed protein product [Dovyalis caffra]|uniref:PCI domain-containing protein n=1 Tax=Dovyalis caffra TaxID=77055 RepID=A0AAV1S3Y3_9ROSI|nr:unnamed protein product [Dovyalis caffra]
MIQSINQSSDEKERETFRLDGFSDTFDINSSRYLEAKACVLDGVTRLKNLSRDTVDTNCAFVSRNLRNLYNTAALHRDELSQAEKLRSKEPKFQTRSSQQIRTIQLEYTEAKKSFQLADWRAPTAARDFRIHCKKWVVLVRLLLGEIPERTIFTQSGMQGALTPYFELTNVNRTNNVIVRLRPSVIRIGLRSISISYSRISLADVANKLKMHSTNLVADVESVVAKAIRDGVINAKIDHANGWIVLEETGDIYSTAQPQAAFSSRIAFCLKLHNKAAQALRFPLDKYSPDEWKSAEQILKEHNIPF